MSSFYTVEVTISRKVVETSHPAVFFNDIPVAPCSTHKHVPG